MPTATFDWSVVQNITYNGSDVQKIDLAPTGSTTSFDVTVVNSSGNKFAFNAAPFPVLTLQRGTTYTFDQSDSTNAGHPLAFRDTSDASYTTGVTVTGTAGQAGAKVEFAVPSNAPSVLKYYCTVHGNGMGSAVSTIASGSSASTEMWRKVYTQQSETQSVWVPPTYGNISTWSMVSANSGTAYWYVNCNPSPGYTWGGPCGDAPPSCACPSGQSHNCGWTNVGQCPWTCTIQCGVSSTTWGQTAAGYYEDQTVDTSYWTYFY